MASRARLKCLAHMMPYRGPSSRSTLKQPYCSQDERCSGGTIVPKIHLTLVIGRHAQAHHLADEAKTSLTETVRAYRNDLPDLFTLPPLATKRALAKHRRRDGAMSQSKASSMTSSKPVCIYGAKNAKLKGNDRSAKSGGIVIEGRVDEAWRRHGFAEPVKFVDRAALDHP